MRRQWQAVSAAGRQGMEEGRHARSDSGEESCGD